MHSQNFSDIHFNHQLKHFSQRLSELLPIKKLLANILQTKNSFEKFDELLNQLTEIKKNYFLCFNDEIYLKAINHFQLADSLKSFFLQLDNLCETIQLQLNASTLNSNPNDLNEHANVIHSMINNLIAQDLLIRHCVSPAQDQNTVESLPIEQDTRDIKSENKTSILNDLIAQGLVFGSHTLPAQQNSLGIEQNAVDSTSKSENKSSINLLEFFPIEILSQILFKDGDLKTIHSISLLSKKSNAILKNSYALNYLIDHLTDENLFKFVKHIINNNLFDIFHLAFDSLKNKKIFTNKHDYMILLMSACQHGDFKIAKDLLNHAFFNNIEEVLLECLVNHPNKYLLQFLLSEKSSLFDHRYSNIDLLKLAVCQKNKDLLYVFICLDNKKLLSFDYAFSIPLIQQEDERLKQFNSKVDLSQRGDYDLLTLAALLQRVELFDTLIDFDQQLHQISLRPLSWPNADFFRIDHANIYTTLSASKIGIDCKNQNGMTIFLLRCMEKESLSALQNLVVAGANISVKTPSNKSAEELCEGKEDFLNFLDLMNYILPNFLNSLDTIEQKAKILDQHPKTKEIAQKLRETAKYSFKRIIDHFDRIDLTWDNFSYMFFNNGAIGRFMPVGQSVNEILYTDEVIAILGRHSKLKFFTSSFSNPVSSNPQNQERHEHKPK